MRKFGYYKVAACVPEVKVADVDFNVESIIAMARQAAEGGASLAVFPELCITGYTPGDLFGQRLLPDSAGKGLLTIAAATAVLPLLIVVGMPMRVGNALANVAVVLYKGEAAGVVPKSYIPQYGEFYEGRRFTRASDLRLKEVEIDGKTVPFGTDIIFCCGDMKLGIEICEDLWVPDSPSTRLALAGANVIANLSATDELIGKYDYLRSLIVSQSARCRCAYIYSSAGFGESSTDLLFSGNGIIAEDGNVLAATRRLVTAARMAEGIIDLHKLESDRLVTGTFAACAAQAAEVRMIHLPESGREDYRTPDFTRNISRTPFIPADSQIRNDRCEEIADIQALSLAQRLRHIGCKSVTIGISGGLDSTLALLVSCRAFDILGLDRKGINAVTMPGFGTSQRTHTNADNLMEELGVTALEIPIAAAVTQHFKDIGHNPDTHDITYENSQARERTQILMDYANKTGGIVIGTGDMSELALGWCTYSGDHISMYGVNAGVPKTLVKHLVEWYAGTAEKCGDSRLAATLRDIIDTPISPELTPSDSEGKIAQITEDLVGPYILHDFYLYYVLRHGFSPRKIFFLARKAFAGEYSDKVLLKWLDAFYRRFFAQQFKRSCLPDGPKIGSVALSPRGDWRMPSDASRALWSKECENLINEFCK